MSILFEKSSTEKRRHEDVQHRHDDEVIGSLCRLGDCSSQESLENWVDEKRVRRAIANSNERRRMQSINAGFQSLRTLLPLGDGEKLSKAAILQQTTEYIYQLEQEKSRLIAQNCHLKRLVGPMKKDLMDVSLSPEAINEVTVGSSELPVLPDSAEDKKSEDHQQQDKEKKKGMLTGEAYSRAVDRLRKEVSESRALLEAERKLRLKLEEQIHALEAQLQLQIEVPDVDASEITAHILGRKPNLPGKVEMKNFSRKEEVMDEDSDLIAAARSASCMASQKWSGKKAASLVRRNVMNSSSVCPALNQPESSASPNSSNDQTQVQFITPQGTLMTSIPAHLVLDDRPSSQAGSLLEAAMMAEPKVEVELASRVPSPALSLAMTAGPSSPANLPLSSLPVLSFQLPPHLAHLSHLGQDGSSSPIVLQHSVDEVTFVDIEGQLSTDSKSYLAATSRQNLETIVEAIRHLEGDHLFNDDETGSRSGQLVRVEIDSDTIGCSLVVTNEQHGDGDESMEAHDQTHLHLDMSEDQEVGGMITVSSEADAEDGEGDDASEGVAESNVIERREFD